MSKGNFYSRIPLPILVVLYLCVGLCLGYLFPKNEFIGALHTSGTYFPKTIVTFAALLIFNLLAAAMSKLMLYHKEQAGKLFGLIFGAYLFMGAVSLVYVTGWIAVLSDIPMFLPGLEVPGPMAWISQIGHTFANVLTQQPLLQALVGAMVVGWFCAKSEKLQVISHGFIAIGDMILWFFKKLLWYYPIMIGCLAIGIPMKFGAHGLALYGQAVLWVMIVTVTWVGLMILLCRYTTKRTWKQIFSYYGAVWPTGFGTGGSYDTLAINIISAERDLGLHEDIAEVSIVFGTVLNKNCSTMSVLIVTIIVSQLLGVPISLSEILMLIPPVMILGLESPGIPGGAGYFMSPIIAVLLGAPDTGVYVTTFVAVFSGLIPMFSTAGNTTDDGVVGAFLQDHFGHWITGHMHKEETAYE
ncbi:cation:dicarboxylate symporter family transporter [Nitratidesulfovibrio sp. SRB-5]|uniref:cation:dicarboxylate symporter family transporter n=1 Tax=Nitratidesulfovibrio sp. SRB-5 TaxID=2872636 RepID=UPI0010250943|nr:cation:dicarboxylase symporter family transporter [Nitratidesulfovibrio sp. SRB-5]MBZ2172965.1 dicarboxylate/amino acid:cation symporter [Nitratidesulfovibrio sp. SRB-5]RXF78500.1 cation:dicarboxylase symporter family transporter [Desulfovibrio sp. DS-1]